MNKTLKILLILFCAFLIIGFGLLNFRGSKSINFSFVKENLNNISDKTSISDSTASQSKQDNKKKADDLFDNEEKPLLNPDNLNISSSSESEVKKNDNGTVNTGEKKISVILYINSDKYETLIAEDSSAYDLMQKLEEAGLINFKGKEFSGIGFFVEEINGLKNDPASSSYWIYYINGQQANVGISSYKIKANDIILWRYEEANF